MKCTISEPQLEEHQLQGGHFPCSGSYSCSWLAEMCYRKLNNTKNNLNDNMLSTWRWYRVCAKKTIYCHLEAAYQIQILENGKSAKNAFAKEDNIAKGRHSLDTAHECQKWWPQGTQIQQFNKSISYW